MPDGHRSSRTPGVSIAAASAPSSTRRRWFALLAVTAGVVAALIVVDQEPGINIVIVGALMGAAVLILVNDRMTPVDWAFAITAFVFLAMFAVRTSEWVLFLDLCAAAGLGSLAMSGGTTWAAIIKGGFAVLRRLHRGLGPVLAPAREAWHGLDRVAKAPLLRGTLMGLLLAVVFGALFASADRAFGQLAHDLFVPDWDVGLIPARVLTAVITICFTGAYASVATVPSTERRWGWTSITSATRERRPLQIPEWAIPIGFLNVVFAAFVAVQITVLFGGRQHVLETAGLTYAEYARSGFFQLVVIAGLVLAVIASTVRFGDARAERDRTWMRWLLGVLCVLTIIVLISALRRLGLYEEAYGFTSLRFFVHVTIFWLAAVFLVILIAGVRWTAGWLPRTVVGITTVGLLVVNIINPEGFIASQNIKRYERTGKIDIFYLDSLSPDAVPALASLPAELRACVLTDRFLEKESFWSFNLSRARARSVLASLPDDLAECRP